MRLTLQLRAAAILVTQLPACIPVIAAGGAATGVMIADRRTSGTSLEDQEIELKARQAISEQLGDNVHASVTSFNRNVLLTCEAFIEESKSKAEALVKKGIALEELRRMDEALQCYDRAIAADGDLTIAYLQKGGLFNRLERYEEALQCYEQALHAQEKAHAS